MNISTQQINILLQNADIEGFIEAGAPTDEYLDEAASIAQALRRLRDSEVDAANIAEIITDVWGQSFDLGIADLRKRETAIHELAHLIIKRN